MVTVETLPNTGELEKDKSILGKLDPLYFIDMVQMSRDQLRIVEIKKHCEQLMLVHLTLTFFTKFLFAIFCDVR